MPRPYSFVSASQYDWPSTGGDATIAPQLNTSRCREFSHRDGQATEAFHSGRVMDHVTLIGLLAGALTTIAFIPQLQQTWQTRSAKDVSLGMLLTFTTGVALWLLYGLLLGALPIILANLVTLVLTLAILILKLRFRRRQDSA